MAFNTPYTLRSWRAAGLACLLVPQVQAQMREGDCAYGGLSVGHSSGTFGTDAQLGLLSWPGDNCERKRAFRAMAALQILAMPRGIAAVRALPWPEMHRFHFCQLSPGQGGRSTCTT